MTLVLRGSSLTDSLSDAFRAEIIAGHIPVGERLTESWVATRFDVARPTAKAALDRLTNEGLLRRGPRKSAIVPNLSADDVRDIYFSREPIESRAVLSLAEQSNIPADAERAFAMMTVAAQRHLHTEHTEADIAFHRALVSATGSTRLRRMHETVMGETQLCIAQVRRRTDVDLIALTAGHGAILDAIRAGDPSRAVGALKDDLFGCRDTLLDGIPEQLSEVGLLRVRVSTN